MSLGQKLSVNIAPLLLRTGLAATFIWIGTPMLRTIDLTPSQTAQLANADIRTPSPASAAPDPDRDQPPTTPEITPDEDADDPDPIDLDDDEAGGDTPPPLAGVSLTRRANQPDTQSEPAAPATGQPRYTPSQFEGTTQKARRWVLVSLTALDAAEPVDDGDDATPDRSILPAAVGNGGIWVKIGSIAIALIVAIGGWAVALGFFTRVWALLLAICTALSMWVLELGPAWAARDGLLGFLPDPQLNDPDASAVVWMPLMLHMVVLMTALALFILGPGRLSVDGLMFGRSSSTRHRDAFAEDEN